MLQSLFGRRGVRATVLSALIGWVIGAASAAAAPIATVAPTLPSGGQVQAGAVQIAPGANAFTITQSSPRGIINWSSFSIGQGGAVQFNNGNGATLNRVTGNTGSAIDGRLSGTGSVYLINPNGVIIDKTGVVNVGGSFVASTLDIPNSQFLAGGDLAFAGSSAAAVINYGKIGSLGGDVALIASRVVNDGEIDAPNGDAGLLAGYSVVLRDKALDDGKFAVLVGGGDTSATNGGAIQAADAELRANGGNVYALAGNTQSIIKATGVSASDGKVFLVAEGGSLGLAGTIQARAANGAGGQIETSGAVVRIGAANIDAGAGGSWLLDPDDLTIDQTAADTIATSLNAGTNVTQQTTASGSGGNGDIFVSPNVSLNWSTSASLTLSAYRDIDIGAGSVLASTGGGAVTLYADNSGTGVGTVTFGAGASVSTSGPVAIFYNPSVNPVGSGVNPTSYVNPTENFAANVTGGGALTSYMLVNTLADLQNIRNNVSGTYALGADVNAAASATWNANGDGTYAGFVPIGGNAQAAFTGTLEGNGHTVSNLFIDFTTDYPSVDPDGFSSNGSVGLFGAVGSGGVIRDVNLANANVTGGNGMAVGALAGGAIGGQFINTSSSGVVTGGTDAGLGFSVGVGGLVGGLTDGALIATSYSSATVSGGDSDDVGGLAGALVTGSSITSSYATGDVSSGATSAPGIFATAGGLVGAVYGFQFGGVNPTVATVSNSYATGSVTGGAGSFVGGLAGSIAQGQVSTSYATGDVTGGSDSDAGGFAGVIVQSSQVATSYATGSVTQTAAATSGVGISDIIGGFVGYLGTGGAVSQAYSSGAVATVSGPGNTLAGGFVGDVDAGGSVANAYTLSSVTSAGVNVSLIGGFAGILQSGGSITAVYATGHVSGVGARGGLVGFLNGGSLSNSYWDTGTTGLSAAYCCTAVSLTNVVGVGGATGISPYAAATYAGFDLSASGPWVIFDGSTRPVLRMEASTTITNGHQLQLMALDPTASYTLANDVDLTATSNTSDIWNPATGFVPIGGNAEALFTGTFEGAGHTISNLYINFTTPYALSDNGFTGLADVGLFGAVGAGGVVRNINLADANVTASDGMTAGALAGTVEGGQVINASSSGVVTGGSIGSVANAPPAIGGLVGYVADGALVANSDSSAQVSAGSDEAVGGLVGSLGVGASITSSYATGNVSSTGPGGDLGGLVGNVYGYQFGGVNPDVATITNSYATGDVTGGSSYAGGFAGLIIQGEVTDSYATGTVTQTAASATLNNLVGGFVGYVGAGGVVTQSYSSGAVSTVGGLNSSFYTIAGGFAGDVTAGGSVDNSYTLSPVTSTGSLNFLGGFTGYLGAGSTVNAVYATGRISGVGATGGLVGLLSGGTLSNAYWDEGTTGQVNAYCCTPVSLTNVSGLTTAQLQSGLPGGFSGGVWSTVAGETYPYLAWQFPSGAPQVVTGFALESDGTTGLAGAPVAVYFGGSQLASAQTGGGVTSGANGYYYYLLAPGTLPASPANNVGALLYASDGTTVIGLGYNGGGSLADGSMTGLNIADQDPFLRTNATSYSQLTGDLSATFGAAVYAAATADLGQSGDLTQVQASGDFTIDEALNSADRIQIESGGDLTISSAGSITSSASGDAIILAANGSFINDAGASAVTATDGRWLIYSQASGDPGAAPTGDVFGGLSAKSYYGDAFTFNAATTDAFATTPNAGDRFVYGYQPTLSITPTTQSLVYNGQAQTDTFTVAGLQNGDSQADALQGSVTGRTAPNANVNTYTLTASGALTSDENYAISLGSGVLSITPKPLTDTLTGSITKVYNGTNAAALTAANYMPLTGVIAGDQVRMNTPTKGVYSGVDVGSNLLVTASNVTLTGAQASDYTIVAYGDIGSITPKTLTASLVGSVSKVYDGTKTAVLSATNTKLTGEIAGDSVTAAGTANYSGKDVGTGLLVSVTGASLSGAQAEDYVLASNNYSGTIGKITPATVTASLTGVVDKIYDGTTTAMLSAGNYALSGLVAGDVGSVGLNDPNSGTYNNKNVGTGKAVSVSGLALTGTDALDYTLKSSAVSGAIGEIDPLAISASLTGTVDKTYDGTTTATVATSNYQLTGVLAGDTVKVTGPKSGAYASKDVGTGIAVTVSGVTLGGAGASNYVLTSTTLIGAVGEIDRKVLTASLVSSVVKGYDGTMVAFMTVGNYALTGVIAGDVVSLNDPTTGTYNNANVATNKKVTVVGLALTGADARDYTVNSSASAAIGTIHP